MEGIICDICPHHCLLSDKKTGICGFRQNRNGKIIPLSYGKFSAVNLDPIEKKPLYHFLPGTRTFSVGGLGCNLHCQFCQNWSISQNHDETDFHYLFSPEELVETVKNENLPSLSFTYNEPLISPEFIEDTARLCQTENIKTIIVTAAFISPPVFSRIIENIDGANIDLKFFTNENYKHYTGGSLNIIKENIKEAASRLWLEITNLLIPELNDSPEEIEKMCRWIINETGAETPVHFTAFYPAYKLSGKMPTPEKTLLMARDIARKCGLLYVYTGNIINNEGSCTRCPDCGQPIIERKSYFTSFTGKNSNICDSCGFKLPGFF